MAALKEAKDLAKRFPDPTADELLAAAYRARVADLAQAGMHAEARELLHIAGARFPAHAEEWRALALTTARASGDVSDLLARWRAANDDATARAALAEELRQNVLDPRTVAESGILAPGDPLRVEARAVDAAFTAAAAGVLSGTERDGLRAVGRRSPFADWRNFVLALDAFHRHDDDACARRLESIRADSAVARGKQILLARLSGEVVGAEGTVTRRLELRVSDGLVAVAEPLAILRAADAVDRTRIDAARSLLTTLAAKNARLAERVIGHFRMRRAFDRLMDDLYDGLGQRLLGIPEWTRVSADWDAERDPAGSLRLWLSWLMPRSSGHELRALADVELAALLDRIAELGFVALPQIHALFGPELLTDPARIRPGTAIEAAALTVAMLNEVCQRLRRRTGVVVTAPPPLDLLEYATLLEPTAARFDRLVELAEDDAAPERDVALVLERWAAAIPADPEPLVRLARAAESRRALKKALGYIARAEARNAVDERVRAARLRIQVAQLREHHRAGRVHLCANDLQQIDANPAAQAGPARTVFAAVRGELGLAAPSEVIAAAGSAARATAVSRLARALLTGDRTRVPLDPAPLADRLTLLAWLVRVAEAVDIDLATLAPIIREPARAEIDPGAIPPGDTDRLALCRHGAVVGDWSLIASISGCGLLDDGPHLSRYVLFRARAIEERGQDWDRARGLRQLARALAVRVGDHAAAREADSGGWVRLDELDAEAVRQTLADERRHVRRTPSRPQPQQRQRRQLRLPSQADAEATENET